MKSSKPDEKILWKWRDYFSESTRSLGYKDYLADKMISFVPGEDGRSARGRTVGGFIVEVMTIPTSPDELKRYPRWDTLYSGIFSKYYHCSCSQGSQGTRCRHLANLMYCWEEVHGPFEIKESEEDRQRRLEAERLEREKAKKQQQIVDAGDYFGRLPQSAQHLYFQADEILRKTEIKTNQYEIEQAEKLMVADDGNTLSMYVNYDNSGNQYLAVEGRFQGPVVSIALSRDKILKLHCTCGNSGLTDYWYSSRPLQGKMCGHALALWSWMLERLQLENPGDATDRQADMLMKLMTRQPVRLPEAASPIALPEKKRNVVLAPRIVRNSNNNELRLGFDIGETGGRLYAMRKLEDLMEAVDGEKPFKVTKTMSVDFASQALTEASEQWYQMVTARVRAVERINRRLEGGNYYYSRKLSVGDGIPLENSDLDLVYDLSEGGEILYQTGSRNEVSPVRVGPARPRATVKLDPIVTRGHMGGIRITGEMPRTLKGSLHQYILDRDCFGRVDDESLDELAALRNIDSGDGTFSCVVGEKKFTDFFYRVLPQWQNARQITLTDNVSDKLERLVPPEPDFVFYIDLNENLTCAVNVQYGEQIIALADPNATLPVQSRDLDQEKRVEAVVREYFVHRDLPKGQWWIEADDDTLVMILTEAVPRLSAFGEVKGSDAFRRIHIQPAPQPKVSLHVEGGLLDLAVQTKDLSPDELLDLLDSYSKKKRWHRLKSGDFIDLTNAEALDELVETVQTLDVPLEQLIREGAQVPKYRALYVDKLLEDHDALAASRDKQFKALIRSFQTIRDSDFEVSEGLADVLRPYQVYGFRWLSTLAQSGFGGILADEMGLGKTLELLSWLQTQYDAGEKRPSLVVCPASLVYNWREEARKFAPTLTVQTLDGNLPARKKLFKAMGEDGHALLYITSYDLLKRDITFYDGMTFAAVALDEAQYVKNQRTAVSKAVRVLSADHRFALTGTPIENRLSELWSIFDFLMPGFLYSAQEFSTRFENPIMKQKDPEATSRLNRMTAPFILRRRKADVLKDLPDKLEETRASAMEPDQRQLYDAQVIHMREVLAQSADFGKDKLKILAEITRLRQLCCDPSLVFEDYKGTSAKRAACLELIQNAIDGGHRMLVFSQFTSMLDLLAGDLKDAGIEYYTITGATPKQERLRLVNAFNEGTTPVFLISLKAGGTGLNLTGADVVIHYDPWWNLAVQNQATDRAHRIGQTRQVTVIRLIAAETIEDKIVQLQEAKRDLAESIISGEGASLMSFSKEEFMELLG